MNQYIQNIEGLFDKWKTIFDNPPTLDFSIEVKDDGYLYINNTALCPAEDIDLEKSYHDVELLFIVTRTGMTFVIEIDWPFEDNASISRIIKQETIYSKKDTPSEDRVH